MAIMRSLGDSLHPLYYLIISSALNMALDLLFVAAFHLHYQVADADDGVLHAGGQALAHHLGKDVGIARCTTSSSPPR